MTINGEQAESLMEVWGVLGGMGPLASAEFLKTIYEENAPEVEQEAPIVYLLSDPTIPDRTKGLLNGGESALLSHFSARVEQLISLGVTRIVVCCVTIHPLIHRLPAPWQQKIISLLDIVFAEVLSARRRHLLMCTEGTRKMDLFRKHDSWEKAEDYILLPTEEDQALIHRMIYEIKGGRQSVEHVQFVEELLHKYGVDSYIAGCTEIHMLTKFQERINGRDRRKFSIDPLTIMASRMARRINAAAQAS
jgi:aspartate racemase